MSGTLVGITPTLDKVPLDHFARELEIDIDNHKIFEEEWEFRVARNNLPNYLDAGTGQQATSLEIWGPVREDKTRFYASLDTNTYVGKNTNWASALAYKAWPYAPGTEMRITTDLERVNNYVTTDSNLAEYRVLKAGKGTDVLLEFARMAEQAKEFNAPKRDASGQMSGPNFSLMSRGKDTDSANGNSAVNQILKNRGYDIHHIGRTDTDPGLDLTVAEKGGFLGIGDTDIPAAGDDVSNLFQQTEPGFFEGLSFPTDEAGRPVTDGLVLDAKIKEQLVKLITELHPDYIAATDPDMGGAQPGGMTPKIR